MSASPPPRQSGVLVVDSDESRRRGLVRLLADRGIAAYGARGIEGARLALSQSSFAAVVSRMGLDDGSGLNLLTDIRAGDPRVPVVVWFEPPAVIGRAPPVALWFLRESIDATLYGAIEDAYRVLAERESRRFERQPTIPFHHL